MTYGKIGIYSLAAAGFVALFWSLWLLGVELFGAGFESIPTVPNTLELFNYNKDEFILVWSTTLPAWLAGLSRAATDPIATIVFVATYLVLVKTSNSPYIYNNDGDMRIAVGVILGFLFGSILSNFPGIATTIIVGTGFAFLFSFFGLFSNIAMSFIFGVSFITTYTLIMGIVFGGPIGLIALFAMAVPYLVFGICYLLYRGAREVIIAPTKQTSVAE